MSFLYLLPLEHLQYSLVLVRFPEYLSEELQKATAVFSGTVTDINEDSRGQGYAVKFDVEKIWKGISEKTVFISTNMSGASCGYAFKKGEKYLVYANGKDSLSASICSRAKVLSVVGEDISVLGNGGTPIPSSYSSQEVGLFGLSYYLIFVIVLTIVVFGFVLYGGTSSQKRID